MTYQFNEAALGLLLLITGNSGQLLPVTARKDDVNFLLKKGYIEAQKVRNSVYYYPSPVGSQIATSMVNVAKAFSYK